MARGRCAGCGKEGSACQISSHVLECQGYADVYRADPAAALDPVAALISWKGGQQQEHKQQSRAATVAGHQALRASQALRYAQLPDPLAE